MEQIPQQENSEAVEAKYRDVSKRLQEAEMKRNELIEEYFQNGKTAEGMEKVNAANTEVLALADEVEATLKEITG